MRLIPFIYSASVAYKAQLGDEYMRFFYQDQHVDAISSPYAEDDVSGIQYKQLADTMWMVHPSYAPAKLTRVATDDFSVDTIPFEKGPFLPENDTEITITPATDTPITTTGETYTSSSYYGSSFAASKAFDGISVGINGWISNRPLSEWVAIEFAAAKTVVRLRIQPCVIQYSSRLGSLTNNCNVRRCKVEASNDGLGWTKLSVTQWRMNCQPYNNDEIQIDWIKNYTDWAEVVVSNSTLYTHYRLYCYDNYGNPLGIGVKEIEFYDVAGSKYTSSEPIFESGHVGALWKLRWLRTDTGVSASLDAAAETSSSITVNEGWKLVTYGDWIGAIKLQRSVDSGTTWTDVPGRNYSRVAATDPNILDSGLEYDGPATYRIYMTSRTSGTCTLNLTCSDVYYESIVRITEVISATEIYTEQVTVLYSSAATTRWSEGAWSSVRGYPRSVAFFQGRMVYAGMLEFDLNKKEVRVWFSASDDYDNFDEGVNDDDAFSLVVPSVNEVRWVEALDALFIGTASDEWRIGPVRAGQTLTPTNWNIEQISTYGSAAVQPVKVNDAILFVDFPGRKVRELLYDYRVEKHIATDLTQLSEHITYSGITEIAHQKNPYSILWLRLTDGTLLTMAYNRQQNVVALSSHPLGGSGEADSVCVVPDYEVGEDEVSLLVSRTINSESVTFIERLAPYYYATQADAFFVDAGITKSSDTAFTSITGLNHLEGESVAIWADGGVITPQTVSSGAITLTDAAYKVQVGLASTWYLQPMRIVIATYGGTSMGSKIHIPELVVSFLDSGNVTYGQNDDNLVDVGFPPNATVGLPPDVYTGDIVLAVEGGFDSETVIILTSSDPAPVTIRSIVARLEKTSR